MDLPSVEILALKIIGIEERIKAGREGAGDLEEAVAQLRVANALYSVRNDPERTDGA